MLSIFQCCKGGKSPRCGRFSGCCKPKREKDVVPLASASAPGQEKEVRISRPETAYRKAAGCLPLAWVPGVGAVVLLGEQGKKFKIWSSFGGGVEKGEEGIPRKTATRELFEELFDTGLFSSEKDTAYTQLGYNVNPHFLWEEWDDTWKGKTERKDYIAYLLEIDPQSIDLTWKYLRPEEKDGERHGEKSAIRWFPLDVLLGVKENEEGYPIFHYQKERYQLFKPFHAMLQDNRVAIKAFGASMRREHQKGGKSLAALRRKSCRE